MNYLLKIHGLLLTNNKKIKQWIYCFYAHLYIRFSNDNNKQKNDLARVYYIHV